MAQFYPERGDMASLGREHKLIEPNYAAYENIKMAKQRKETMLLSTGKEKQTSPKRIYKASAELRPKREPSPKPQAARSRSTSVELLSQGERVPKHENSRKHIEESIEKQRQKYQNENMIDKLENAQIRKSKHEKTYTCTNDKTEFRGQHLSREVRSNTKHRERNSERSPSIEGRRRSPSVEVQNVERQKVAQFRTAEAKAQSQHQQRRAQSSLETRSTEKDLALISSSKRRHSPSIERRRASPSSERPNETPLHEVKKRLDFDSTDDGAQNKPLDNFDFTDKIAALRSLMGREKDNKNITDRRAYYDEYKSGARKIMVSRSDSLKENDDAVPVPAETIEKSEKNSHNIEMITPKSATKKYFKDRLRECRSADIFKSKGKDGRMSVVDIPLSAYANMNDVINGAANNDDKNHDSEVKRDAYLDKFLKQDEALLHATKDRKILVSSSGRQSSSRHTDIDNISPEKSLLAEVKETQTSKLNESMRSVRSVQSNVPFYENTGVIGISRETPTFKKSRILCRVQDNVFHHAEPEKDVSGEHDRGQVRRSSRPSSSLGHYRRSPVPDRVSEERLRRLNAEEVLDHLKGKVAALIDTDLEEENQKLFEEMYLRTDNGNYRPPSRNRSREPGSRSSYCSESGNKQQRSNSRTETQRNNKLSDDDMLDVIQNVQKHMQQKPKGSDKKVRDWIRNQESVENQAENYGADGTMVIEELSVSVSVSKTKNRKSSDDSPASSCDKVPIKLDKNGYQSANQRAPAAGASTRVIQLGQLAGERAEHRSVQHRLDQISVAAIREQHRLEREVPVRDGNNYNNNNAHDSMDSDSSIFSLPISIESGETMSSTVQAVKLLRKLYGVDPETRQNLVLMAKCFRRWLNNVLHAKARYQEISQKAQRVSPVSYGVMLRKGDICYRTSILSRYFEQWRSALKNAHLHQAVAELQRRHLLQKGMNAFKWAINRSKLQHAILQDRINGMLLLSCFRKWHDRTEENRFLRLKQSFMRWRQYIKEAQKIRQLQNQSNKRLKEMVFAHWREHFRTRQKQNKADSYFRKTLLSHGWMAWRWFTSTSKEKKRKQALAKHQYESVVQRKMFVWMKEEFAKYSRAKQFNRTCQLRVALLCWRSATRVSAQERREDLTVAMVFWTRSTLRTHFLAWRERQLTCRACRMDEHTTVRHAFTLWKTRLYDLIHQRQSIDQYVRRKLMLTAFQLWCEFVRHMKYRRALGITRIHSALQRHMLHRWVWYTSFQKDLRSRLDSHVYKGELHKQHKCLMVWRARFREKCDIKRAQQFWSNTCAKKAADVWRQVCHKRRLQRLLVETEPLRQLNLQRVFFERWLLKLRYIEEEKHEAADVRSILNHSLLRQTFTKWRAACQQLLTIKPMVMAYQHQLVQDCFIGWKSYVVTKLQCERSTKQFQLVQLRHRFDAWRRHMSVTQSAKEFHKRLVHRHSQQCLLSWRAIIQRKHEAQKLHERHLLKTTFSLWSSRAYRQLQQKRLENMEMERVLSTLREYFDHWKCRVYEQQTHAETGVAVLQQQFQQNQLRRLFMFWRRHFRATLIARENEKLRTRRLAKQALQEWHLYTQDSLTEAVERFAAAIGLFVEDENNSIEHGGSSLGEPDQLQENGELVFEPMNYDSTPDSEMLGHAPVTPRTPRTPKTPRTPRTPRTPIAPMTPKHSFTPRHASALGTPRRRLVSPPLSRQSLVLSLELDSSPRLSSSFLDARFEMEHAVKTESRREIVVTMINRLRNWPVSIVFEQWKEFTVRQREFKHLTSEIASLHQKLALSQYFRDWAQQYREMKLASQHYDQVLQHKALLSLILYRNERLRKRQATCLAHSFYAQRVYTQLFPMWQSKAQEKRHTGQIVHLWTTITDEERALIPRERSFRYSLNTKSLRLCFARWSLAYRKISKLKQAYNKILYNRYFTAWHEWAAERHANRDKSHKFRDDRIKKQVFSTWCLHYHQRTEVETRYKETWHNYLGIIVQAWARWAHDQRKRKLLACQVVEMRQRHLVTSMFSAWKSATQKQQAINTWYQNRLSHRVMLAWHEVTTWRKDLRLRMLKCHTVSCTSLVKQSFRQWQAVYQERLEAHRQHQRKVEDRARRYGQHWRRLAQTTRAEILRQHFQAQQMRRMFARWKAGHEMNLQREECLQEHLSQQNQALVAEYLDRWRYELRALQAERLFNNKLVVTLMANWKLAAKACKERRNTLLAYRQSHDIAAQRNYFLYWFNVAKTRKSIRGHANLKIQLTVFKAWFLYTRKQINLRRLESGFTRRQNSRCLQKHWYLLKTRFDYCVELSEMAQRVVAEKNQAIMSAALQHWVFRLKIVIADEYHIHMLARRVATRWRRFVVRQKQEREYMRRQMVKATKFYNKKLCNKVYAGWFREVLVSRQVEKRRQRLCRNFALQWKHKVDMVYTAKCLRRENLLMLAWKRWHLEYVQRCAIKKVEAFERKQTLSLIFVSWKNLSRKRRRISMIPLPVSPAAGMPGSTNSSSSTPTDELYLLMERPSQIPLPHATRRPSRLPSVGSSNRH